MSKFETPRRDFLRLPLLGGAAALAATAAKNEHDPDNLKLATVVNIRTATDELLLFLSR